MRLLKSTFVVCSILLLFTLPAVGQTVDEIVQKNLEAKGGEQAWKDLQSARMTGTMQMGAQGQTMEAPFQIEWQRPDKVRLEFTMQGMTAIQAFDGETGWAIMPFMGKTEPEEMAEDQLKDMKDQAEFDGMLVDWKEKGHQVEYLGEEEVDGTPAYKLRVTKANGDVVDLYLDKDYYVEFKSETTREIQGNEMQISTVMGDYKEVGGLMFAHSMEASMGGGPAMQVITIDNVELGVDFPDDYFAMPEVEAAEAESEG